MSKDTSGQGQDEITLAKGKERVPVVTHKGTLKIKEVKIQCFVLNNGQRVLSGRAVTKAIGLSGRGPGMERFLEAKSLQPYLSENLVDILKNPIKFTMLSGVEQPLGYEAIVLPELCNAVIDANDNNELKANQKHMVEPAKILLRSFSIVGITALVDEATGYQEVRDRLALQKILDKYITEELRKWTKTFPDEFYEELFRLRNWQYSPMSVKRPALVGRLTNDLVYQRLALGVLAELRRITPRDKKGRTKHRFHQRLTENIGHPALGRHLHAVTAFMKASSNWRRFYASINRAFPKFNETLPLPLVLEDEEEKI